MNQREIIIALKQAIDGIEAHGEMCDKLRTCVDRHDLGYGKGGSRLDDIVIAAVDRLMAEKAAAK